MTAILSFAAVVITTLAVTFWAARRSSGRAGFYAADGALSPGQNGLAIAGDFLSAATLLGTTALYFNAGVDAILYLAPFLLGLCLMLIWIVGPLRKMGRFTIGDVVGLNHQSNSLRVYVGLSTIVISVFYLVAQLVGAGTLIATLFGLPFQWSVMAVGTLMTVYVAFGGMLAASWVQIIKAVMLIGTVIIISVLAVTQAGGLGRLYELAAAVHPRHTQLFTFGGLHLSLISTLSLVVGVAMGTMGLPHLLIRSFTVRDSFAARRSIAIAATLIGGVIGMIFAIIAPSTVAFVPEEVVAMNGGTTVVVVQLAAALGGNALFGVVAAVTFATVLAVVAGLTIAVASASAHDLYGTIVRRVLDERIELRVFRTSTVVCSFVAVALAIAFRNENIAVLIAVALGIAASSNFPVLLLAIYWRGLTARGAIAGGAVGLVCALALIVLGPEVWVHVLGNEHPVSPLEYPALICTPLAFLVAWLVSMGDPSASRQKGGDERHAQQVPRVLPCL